MKLLKNIKKLYGAVRPQRVKLSGLELSLPMIRRFLKYGRDGWKKFEMIRKPFISWISDKTSSLE